MDKIYQQNTNNQKKQRELATTLNHFYANPVAKASMELFLTIGLILFLGAFAIRPTIVTMSDLLKEIETKTDLDEALTKKVAALQTAQNQYLNVENKLTLLDTAIPAQPEIILSTKIIEKIAAESQVIIKSLSISDLPENSSSNVLFSEKSKQNLTISLNIAGDYISIRNFTETLKNSRKSFVIESVVFDLQEDRGSKKLSANITIAAPYFGLEDQDEPEVK